MSWTISTYTTLVLAALNSIDITLTLRSSASKLKKLSFGDYLVRTNRLNTASRVALGNSFNNVVRGIGSFSLLYGDDDLLAIIADDNTVLSRLVIVLATLGGDELDDGAGRANSRQPKRLNTTAPHKGLELIEAGKARDPLQNACTVLSS